MARKVISKKLRFEVFKRDSFKCQYCGRTAPEVVLHADHVQPVAAHGKTDILNLITSCLDCNLGKGARSLSDHSVMQKQRDQLEGLQERREQLEMMIQWKQGLAELEECTVDELIYHWERLAPGWRPREQAVKELHKTVRKFGFAAVMDAMQIAADQYLVFDGDAVTSSSWSFAWKKIVGICRVTKATENKPYLRDLYYVRGILRKRFGFNKEYGLMPLLEAAVAVGVSTDQLKDVSRTAISWSNFEAVIENTIEARSDGKGLLNGSQV
jgi:hypothetical protein